MMTNLTILWICPKLWHLRIHFCFWCLQKAALSATTTPVSKRRTWIPISSTKPLGHLGARFIDSLAQKPLRVFLSLPQGLSCIDIPRSSAGRSHFGGHHWLVVSTSMKHIRQRTNHPKDWGNIPLLTWWSKPFVTTGQMVMFDDQNKPYV